MTARKAIASVALGLAVCAASFIVAVPQAHALTQTECRGYNSMYLQCTTYKYNFATGGWDVANVFFKLIKEASVEQ